MFDRSFSFANGKLPAAIMGRMLIRVYRNWRSTSLEDEVWLPITPHSAEDSLPFTDESHTLERVRRRVVDPPASGLPTTTG